MNTLVGMDLVSTLSYKDTYGFKTSIKTSVLTQGLSERTIRIISRKKCEPNYILFWRLSAYFYWLTLCEPKWSLLEYKSIEYYNIVYYAVPRLFNKNNIEDKENALLLDTYHKLNVNLKKGKLEGIAVDAVFDSVSIITTFKKQLYDLGVIFSSFSEALIKYPALIRKYLGCMVPFTDNFFSALNSAVFSDGSFCYIPCNVMCPVELSTYFRINTTLVGQFERTLLIADKGSYVSYLEGCTAPAHNKNNLHAAVVEVLCLEGSEIKYSTVQNWYPGDCLGVGGVYNFVTKRGVCAGKYSKITWVQVEAGSARTWKYPSVVLYGDYSVGEFYSVAFTNNYQQTDTGTKMHHIGKKSSSSVFSKSVLSGFSKSVYRGLVNTALGCVGATNYTQCDSLLLSGTCVSVTYPELSISGGDNYFTHEAMAGKLSYSQLLYCLQRGLTKKGATVMIINGFCTNILHKLPTEFSVEIQNLIERHFEEVDYVS